MSFFESYRSAEGLDQFPRDQQFWVWCAAHKRLKANDPGYRMCCRLYAAKIFAASAWLALVSIVGGFNVIGLGMIEQAVLCIVATAVCLLYIVIVSFRQTKWLNARVAAEIKKQPTGPGSTQGASPCNSSP